MAEENQPDVNTATVSALLDQVVPAVNETLSASKLDDELGIFVTYAALMTMAVLPILIGSYRSLTSQSRQKEAGEVPIESMTNKDAAFFPIIASFMLFGLYVTFKVVPKEYVNILLSVYFTFLGVLALSKTIRSILIHFSPSILTNVIYRLEFSQTRVSSGSKTEYFSQSFDYLDLLSFAISCGFGAWYYVFKHWIANNILGLVFATSAVEMLQLGSYQVGAILLGGLFVYDIFWVFGTDVMVTVAKSFEAPVKLLFPKDILVNGVYATNFAMLGLGDIVIPGILIALLLRFDRSRSPSSIKYFLTGVIAYFVGLGTTIFVMHTFKAAQPALLYLVPTCLGFSSLVALASSEFNELLSYSDSKETDDKKKSQ